MKRLRVSVTLVDEGDGAPEPLAACPSHLAFPLRRSAGGPLPEPRVKPGDTLASGDCLAESPQAAVHAACAGTVASVDATTVRIECTPGAPWSFVAQASLAAVTQRGFGQFLAAAGIVGMGGGQFPASVKFAASRGVHTLVVNGAECEPGTTIDTQLLLHDGELVRIGAEALASAVGATEIVLAIGHAEQSDRIGAAHAWRLLHVPAGYPAGAERLVLEKLTGRRPPASILPAKLGVLVQNVATVRAIGRALRDGVPCVERPLSVIDIAAGRRRNLIVPVGIAAEDVFAACGWSLPSDAAIVAGGLMMGALVGPRTPVTRGTTSLVLVPRGAFEERACIRCGACYDRCPLGLHPIDLAERVRAEARPFRTATQAQLSECFLCGVCSSVCPSRIPIAARLREARYG